MYKSIKTKNIELREIYIVSQIRYHKSQKKRIPPPNCSNDQYYKSIGIYTPECDKMKNPLIIDTRRIFKNINQITIPPRPDGFRLVYHLYIVFAKDRDGLLRYCIDKGIEAKIHYPVPIYRQPALQYLGHKQGDFPISDSHTKKIITFPCDQHLERSQLDYIIETVSGYYEK